MTIRVVSSTQYYRVTNTGAVTMVLAGPAGPAGASGGGGGASDWGDIGGTLSDQTDLQTALDAKVDESLFDANTILKADSDNTPAALTVAEQRLVGRITAGVITALTAAQVRTLINVEDGATADMSAAEILAALLTVDGSGSGLDADLLDGTSSAGFATSSHDHSGVYQPVDSDLTAIAALSPSNDDVVQRKAGAWTNRTIAQLLTDLAAAGTTFQPLDADLTALATAFATASASGPATLALHEDTDNGSNKVTISAPTSVASDKTVTLPDLTGTALLDTSGARVYFHSGGSYSLTGGRIFIGDEDPSADGFTPANGDIWEDTSA